MDGSRYSSVRTLFRCEPSAGCPWRNAPLGPADNRDERGTTLALFEARQFFPTTIGYGRQQKRHIGICRFQRAAESAGEVDFRVTSVAGAARARGTLSRVLPRLSSTGRCRQDWYTILKRAREFPWARRGELLKHSGELTDVNARAPRSMRSR